MRTGIQTSLNLASATLATDDASAHPPIRPYSLPKLEVWVQSYGCWGRLGGTFRG